MTPLYLNINSKNMVIYWVLEDSPLEKCLLFPRLINAVLGGPPCLLSNKVTAKFRINQGINKRAT